MQHETAGWVRALWPAVGILIAHYVWVMRSDAAFEEAAAEESFKRASRSAAGTQAAAKQVPGSSLSAPPFRLAANGWPATAIYWKNLTSVARTRRVRNIFVAFTALSAAVALLSIRQIGPVPSIVGALAATWAALSLVMGPQWIRNDLRMDLGRLELLRSYPVSGADIVAAEVAASATVLTLVQLMLAGFAYCAALGDPNMDVPLPTRTLALAAATLILPGINYIGLLLQNGAALLYPAWVRIGPGRSAGVEGLGQNMLAMIAYAIALLAALLVPTGACVGIWLALRPTVGDAGVVPGGVVGLALLAAECVLLIRPLGRVFERIDIAGAGINPG